MIFKISLIVRLLIVSLLLLPNFSLLAKPAPKTNNKATKKQPIKKSAISTLIKRMEVLYKKRLYMKASFQQTLVRKSPFPSKKLSEGIFYFQKPAFSRWDFETENKSYLSDGKVIWILDQKSKQISRPHAINPDDNLLTRFFNGEGLSKLFDITKEPPKSKSSYTLNFKPKSDMGDFAQATVMLDKKSLFFTSIDIYYQNGNIAQLKFGDISTKPLNKSLFFPPKKAK